MSQVELGTGNSVDQRNRMNEQGMWWDDASLAWTTMQRKWASAGVDNRTSMWKPGVFEVARVDVLQMSLERQAHLESELRSKEVQLKAANKMIENLSREMATLAVAHDSAVDTVKRARTVLECILSGRFQEELETYIQDSQIEIDSHNISIPTKPDLGRLASLARGFSPTVLLMYIMQAFGLQFLD